MSMSTRKKKAKSGKRARTEQSFSPHGSSASDVTQCFRRLRIVGGSSMHNLRIARARHQQSRRTTTNHQTPALRSVVEALSLASRLVDDTVAVVQQEGRFLDRRRAGEAHDQQGGASSEHAPHSGGTPGEAAWGAAHHTRNSRKVCKTITHQTRYSTLRTQKRKYGSNEGGDI